MVLNLGVFVFPQNIATRKIRRCWFQIWQYYFWILTQKPTSKAFLVPRLRIFIFAPNFTKRQIRANWSQVWKWYFQIPVQKYTNLAFGPKFKDFWFRTNICSKANSRALNWNMTKVFQNCSPIHSIKAFLVPNWRLFLHQTLQFWQIWMRWFQI